MNQQRVRAAFANIPAAHGFVFDRELYDVRNEISPLTHITANRVESLSEAP
jgi:hypothetical protein